MIVFFGLFTACAPDEPDSVDSQSWRKIQDLGEDAAVLRHAALCLEALGQVPEAMEYPLPVGGSGSKITIGHSLAEERHAGLNQP